MNKKILVLFFLVVLAGSFAFAGGTNFAIGGEFGLSALGGLPNSALLSVKFPSLPIMFGIGLQLSENVFNMALTMDWWLLDRKSVV